MLPFYILLRIQALFLESTRNALSFPHRFPKETFGNKKPSKEARKGTFEGQVVAGTRRELLATNDRERDLMLIRNSQSAG
jgi:hypothetical protein